ncbi:MAG: NAD(P)-binding domain-containing protein [Thermoplasmata archaeon]|nr:NAD(P)-binding domain-containing protein [Thermoplasmata archaeon]
MGMKVGILGSGDAGQALGRGFASRGHDVKIGSRTPNSEALAAWKKQVKGKGSTGTLEETAKHGEIIVLVTRGTAAEEVLRKAGVKNLAGKVVIDVTNPLDSSKGPVPGLFVGTTDSLGERLQRLVPEAKLVKAFNTVSNDQMVDPEYVGGNPEMLICGNDAAAKKKVAGILKEFGWPGAMDVGTIEAARWLEASVPLWVLVGLRIGRWDHAFKVVHGS